jgi:hypothetical protein
MAKLFHTLAPLTESTLILAINTPTLPLLCPKYEMAVNALHTGMLL